MISAVVLAALIPFLIVYLVKNAYKRPKNFPPGPPRLPVYGSYWIILAHGFNNLAAAFQKLGRKYDTKILGFHLADIPVVVVNDGELVKEMLNREEFDGRMDILLARVRSFWKKLAKQNIMRPGLNCRKVGTAYNTDIIPAYTGIFFTDGYYWHVQRRFSLRYMRDFGFGRRDENLESVVASEIKEMIDMGLNGPKYPAEHEIVKGNLVYLPHFFSVPFINGLMQVFGGMTLRRPEYNAIWDLTSGGLVFQRSSDDLGRALCLTPWLKDVIPNWSGFKGLQDGNQFFLDFFKKFVDDVISTHDERHDRHFLDMYIKRMKEELGQEQRSTFSVEQLLLVCTDYMFPTATAVGTVLSFLLERMLLQPEIQDRVHEELDRVVGRDRPPTLDDRRNMPYTEACLREMMRYETLVPLGLPHRAVKDTTLAGYDIPENTMVAANYVPLHMDPAVWGDPENFRPERFIENGVLKVAKDKSLPFGAGKRLCAGETYARQIMFQVFASFMQVFQVSTADGKPLKGPSRRIPGIITTMPEWWVRIEPRTF